MYVPAALEVTFTEIMHIVPAGRVPFEKVIDVPPTATLSTPPQVLVEKGGLAITSPVGKMSVKARPVRGVAVLLLMIKVKGTELPVVVTGIGNALVNVGAVTGFTDRLTGALCAAGA